MTKENLESLPLTELVKLLKTVSSPDDNGTFADYLRLIARGAPMASRIKAQHALALLNTITHIDNGKNTLSPMEREQFKEAVKAVRQELESTRDNLYGVKLELDPNRRDVPKKAIGTYKKHMEMARRINPNYDPALSESNRLENMDLLQWLPGRIAKLELSAAVFSAIGRKLGISISNPEHPDH